MTTWTSCKKVFDYGKINSSNANIYPDYWNTGDGLYQLKR